jgi:hypothetical protein
MGGQSGTNNIGEACARLTGHFWLLDYPASMNFSFF